MLIALNPYLPPQMYPPDVCGGHGRIFTEYITNNLTNFLPPLILEQFKRPSNFLRSLNLYPDQRTISQTCGGLKQSKPFDPKRHHP